MPAPRPATDAQPAHSNAISSAVRAAECGGFARQFVVCICSPKRGRNKARSELRDHAAVSGISSGHHPHRIAHKCAQRLGSTTTPSGPPGVCEHPKNMDERLFPQKAQACTIRNAGASESFPATGCSVAVTIYLRAVSCEEPGRWYVGHRPDRLSVAYFFVPFEPAVEAGAIAASPSGFFGGGVPTSR